MGSTAEENMEKWSNLPSPGQHSLMVLIYILIPWLNVVTAENV